MTLYDLLCKIHCSAVVRIFDKHNNEICGKAGDILNFECIMSDITDVVELLAVDGEIRIKIDK